MIHKSFSVIFLIVFFSALTSNTIAQEIEKDSIQTAFREGRWLIGLSGSISSGTTENISSNQKSISNRYRIEMGAGKFIKNRLNIGFIVSLERENFEGAIVRTTENLLFGPKGSYYLSKSEIGSLFFSLSPGFMLYRDEFDVIEEDNYIENIKRGAGFGTFFTFGYSYVIFDRIAFDLGLNWSVYWIDMVEESTEFEKDNHVDYVLSNLSFSFGFNILLD